MITGARQGKPSGLRRLLAAAMAHDLNVFLVPGPEIARAHGLNIEAAGLKLVVSPRHASVLLVIGVISPALSEAAAVIYAQMMRPRALFVLGEEPLPPLPAADVMTGLSQHDLIKGVHRLRRVFTEDAFRSDVSDFVAPVLQVRIEYTCPMHPEVVRNEPGSCPKCGMNLVLREVQTKPTEENKHMDHNKVEEYTCPMHPEVVRNEPGSCPKCGMNLVLREAQPEPTNDHQHLNRDKTTEYTCPMHPEVVRNEPGSCPKCGMFLVEREA